MKKLVAISVLVAGLAAAAFAQDEGKWKVGFMSRFVTDMLFVTSASGKSTTTPASGSAVTREFGKYNKGTIVWFDNADYDDGHAPLGTFGGNRILLSLSNSGENYEFYTDFMWDNWHKKIGAGDYLMDFLGSAAADWHLKGSAGIFDAVIGTHWSPQGWVSTQAEWDGVFDDTLNRFGVHRNAIGTGTYPAGYGGFIAADTFRTWPEWGATAMVGMGLGDNFKFSLGYNINPGYSTANYPDQAAAADPWKSKSVINGTFLFSGRPVDGISFDLFYSILGEDTNTFARKASTGYDNGDGAWANVAGVYLGIDAIENLGLSLGYTASFNVYETGTYQDPADGTDTTKSKPVTYNAPIYSGIDIHLKYSGIENIGLVFSNNISLASVKGEKVDGYKDTVTLMFGEALTGIGAEGNTQDWFQLVSALNVNFGFIENVALTLRLSNKLGVSNDDTTLNGNTSKWKKTNNNFCAGINAKYGAGAMTFGIGLVLKVDSTTVESSESNPSTSFKGESNVVRFGLPIMIQASF